MPTLSENVITPLGIAEHCRKVSRSGSICSAYPSTDMTLVVFEFPDSSVAEQEFMLGQTVEVLKAFLASEFEINMQHLTLMRNDCETMLDPMSIADYMEGEQAEFHVQVLIDHESDWDQGEGKRK